MARYVLSNSFMRPITVYQLVLSFGRLFFVNLMSCTIRVEEKGTGYEHRHGHCEPH